jgi:4-hydroxy-tetrahydrodipicolinate synthase
MVTATPFGLVATAMVTPFASDGAVDHEAVWRLARHLSDHGSDSLVVTGTTGESPTLSDAEKVALYHTVVEAVAEKDTLVVAGTGTYDTRHSVELTEKAAAAGVDGILAVTPYYNRPSQAGLVAHFEAIAGVGLPVMLYNIPGRTGRLIEIETLARLADHPNVAAVKDAVENLDFTSKTINTIPDLPVYSGQDSLTLPSLAVGAVGVVSVASHLVGRQIRKMIVATSEGDWEEARRLHHLLYPVFESCFLETNPTPVKAAINALWGEVGDVRLPLVNASPETVAAIEKAMAAVGDL